jgi:hypothetical protein
MTWLNSPNHFLAIDWSGSATTAGQRRHIFIASWNAGSVTLESGYTREEVCAFLLTAAAQDPNFVVGLDFAFSFPAWWVQEQGCEDAVAMWKLAAAKGEQWLSECSPPFWGRPGRPRPHDHAEGSRLTDRTLRVAGCSIQPKSPFQIGGAGAVGTGSVRGMPMLARLHEAGFHIWPFQAAGLPLVLEIYPRLFTGAVVKSSSAARTAYLHQPRFAKLPSKVRATAEGSEDAFDALCSVLGMVEHAEHLNSLEQHLNKLTAQEGAIWNPK